jgi:hypothetical protein
MRKGTNGSGCGAERLPIKTHETLISVPTLFHHFFDNKAMQVQQLTFPHPSIGLSADNGFSTMTKDIKVIALIKGEEQYVFLYNENNRAETLRLLGRYASNPELSFSWYDAAVLSQKIRQESLQQEREKQRSESSPSSIPLPIDELF